MAGPRNGSGLVPVGLRRRGPGGRAGGHPFGSCRPRTDHHLDGGTDTRGRQRAGCPTLIHAPEHTRAHDVRATERSTRKRDRAGATGEHPGQGQGTADRVRSGPLRGRVEGPGPQWMRRTQRHPGPGPAGEDRDTRDARLRHRLRDPFTGETIDFVRGQGTSTLVQIDHVVALSDAWQKGAQLLSAEERLDFANDPLNLLAVDGPTNASKGDGDAATWLPPNKGFRCDYVARQTAVKAKHGLWMTRAEHDAIHRILSTQCPGHKAVHTAGH